MKLQSLLLLGVAAALPAQTPSKPKPAAPAPAAAAAPAAKAPSQQGHATLADLHKDFQEKKLAALQVYAKANATAADTGDALVEAAGLAMALGRSELALQLGEKPLRDAIANAGSNIGKLVESTTALAEILVENGNKTGAIELLTKTGEDRKDVEGLDQHFASIAASYEMIGSAPKPIDKEDTAGKKIDLAEYAGKVVLIDFWATWCGPCLQEMPHVIAAYEKYKDKGLEIVGISLDREREKLDAFLTEKKIAWRQCFDDNGEVAQAWGVSGIPATYLIGADGKILAVNMRGEQLEKRLAKALGDKPAAPAATPAAAPKK